MQHGDPQVVGVPVFVVGSVSLAFGLVDYVTQTTVGAPVAVIMAGTGLFLLLSMIWAAAVGQSFVASVVGTFGAFWLSYGILVLGVIHNWFAIPPADVQRTVATFAIAWAAFFFIMTLASIRLPVIYTAIIALVVAALCLVAAAYLQTPISTDLLKAAGYVVFVFAGLGLWVAWTVLNLSLGGPAFPPLGRPLLKPRPQREEAAA